MHSDPDTIDVVVADDHDLVRKGILAVLAGIPGVRVTAEAANGEELLAAIERVRPRVVLTDISMPGLDGLGALQQIRARHPEVRVLVVTMLDNPEIMKRAVAMGASGYVLKGSTAQELEHALHAIVTSGSYFGGNVTRQLLQRSELSLNELLTDRQIEILTMIAGGLSSKEIGYDLGLSSKTVDAHRGRIMERLDIHDLASLTLYAVRKGLVKP